MNNSKLNTPLIEHKPNYKKPAFEVQNPENTFISLEKAFQYVGDNSSYQKRVIIVLSIQWVFYSFMTMGFPFLIFSQQSGCLLSEIKRESIQELFNWRRVNSISEEFDLQKDCQNQDYTAIVMVIFYIASCISGLVFPSMADNFGRKYIMVFSILLGSLSVIFLSFTTNIDVLISCLFSSGFFLNGYETICLVYVTEISAKRFKNYSTVTLMIVWAVSQIIFAIIAKEINNWRVVVLFFIGIPILISVIPMIFYLDETPKHLVEIKEYRKATEVLRKISIQNNRPPFRFHLLGEIPTFNQQITKNNGLRKTLSRKINKNIKAIKDITANAKGYIDLIIYRRLRNRTLMMLWLWFTRYQVYFGIQFALAQYDDYYLSLIMTSMGEIIANIIGAPIKLKMRRRSSLQVTLMLMVICSIILQFLKYDQDCEYYGKNCLPQDIQTICATILKFGITIYYAILVTYSCESYPTSMRAKAYGLCLTFGKIGSVVVPFQIIYIQRYQSQHINPFTFVWVSCFISLIFTIYLPETQLETKINDILESDPEDEENQQQNILIEMKKKENLEYVPGTD